jgi:hypothetical protein
MQLNKDGSKEVIEGRRQIMTDYCSELMDRGRLPPYHGHDLEAATKMRKNHVKKTEAAMQTEDADWFATQESTEGIVRIRVSSTRHILVSPGTSRDPDCRLVDTVHIL